MDFEIPTDLHVLPIGENGEVVLSRVPHKNKLNTSKLPCGIPPILPDTKAMLNSFFEHPENLPIFHLDAVQKMVPIPKNISALYSIGLCPLQTVLEVKRDMMTGKLLGFTEEVKESIEGSHQTSGSLNRAPGPPSAGVKGSSGGAPFWPGGMDEPWANLIHSETLDSSLFDGDLLDTPPGFKHGMKFDRKKYDKSDFIQLQPQKIYLSDILEMEDTLDLEVLNDSEEKDKNVASYEVQDTKKDLTLEEEEIFSKLTSLPVLEISKVSGAKSKAPTYEWAVSDEIRSIGDFNEKIPQMARKWDFNLDPFQKQAILHLEKHESVFVAAHTSAGKTVVAEYAIALAQKHFTRIIYTSPIKALSNQKFRDFKETIVDVGLITGDVQKNPTAFCLIMTTEILRSMLYHGSDVIRELEWVIFDEVHYINDLERGVVWEEVLIMLPDHVGLILLSATVPNAMEFAEWLGRIKKRKIYVVSTTKRPVPLSHYLYTGSKGRTEEDIFNIVDGKGQFLLKGYNEALESKTKNDKGDVPNKTKKDIKQPVKFQNHHFGLPQEKSIYLRLLNYLRKKELLPTVCFTFSRRKCNLHAEMLSSLDLTSKDEKSHIKKNFQKWISNLKEEDRNLPQIFMMQSQLERGFGVHHSGILPILKEIVEMLFHSGHLKVLFTTETFAMGVNMPARTVVFDSIRKHDGLNFRDLQPSEYIQMAGRAGRRNQDKTGTVIILCKAQVPDTLSLNSMMRGKPTKLESQFKLTYSMILNLLKVKTIRVEDMMKLSFRESNTQKSHRSLKETLDSTMQCLAAASKPVCSLCNVDMPSYIKAMKEINTMRSKVMEKLGSESQSSKLLVTGRVLAFSTIQHQNLLGILLSISKDKKCEVLAITEKKSLQAQDPSKSPEEDPVFPWTKQLFLPQEKSPKLMTIQLCDIQVIGNKVIKFNEIEVTKDLKRLKSMNSNLGHSASAAFQELCSLGEANAKGFPSANVTLKDIEFAKMLHDLERLDKSFDQFTCIKCPEFKKHFQEFYEYLKMEDTILDCKTKLSEESLTLHPEYQNRKEVLHKLQYIDSRDAVQLKGGVARETSAHELLVTELLVRGTLASLPAADLAALLSCCVFQAGRGSRQDEERAQLDMPSHLAKKVHEIYDVAVEISNEQTSCNVHDPGFVDQYNFALVKVVYEWASGTPFSEIMRITEEEEGILVRGIQRLGELLLEVRRGATLVGDVLLAKTLEEAAGLVRRDIVFAASLYLK